MSEEHTSATLLAQGKIRNNWRGAWIWSEDMYPGDTQGVAGNRRIGKSIRCGKCGAECQDSTWASGMACPDCGWGYAKPGTEADRHSEYQPDRNVYSFFRRTFECAGSANLEIHITANNFYWLYLDGEFVQRGPVRSHLQLYSFDSFDLQVEPGEHCLAVVVHHVGELNATMEEGVPGFIADVVVKQGALETDLSTGEAWKSLPAKAWKNDRPCLMSHFGFWEELDFGQYPQGWRCASFDDSTWCGALIIGRPPCEPWINLVEREIPYLVHAAIKPVRVVGFGTWDKVESAATVPFRLRKHPVTMRSAPSRLEGVDASIVIPSEEVHGRERRPEPFLAGVGFPLTLEPRGDNRGYYITLDFGCTMSGYAIIKIAQAHTGQRVDISFEEIIKADGSVNPERMYCHATDRYVLAEGEVEIRSMHPRGFRYLMLDLEPGEEAMVIEDVHAIKESYPFHAQPAFASPDKELNDLLEKSAETTRACTIDCFTDNPTRERVQWTGECMYPMQAAAFWAFAETRMSRRGLIQAAQAALEDGRIDGFAPSRRTSDGEVLRSVFWLEHLVDYWLFTGNEKDVRQLLPSARRVLAALQRYSNDEGLIVDWPGPEYWDWGPLEGGGGCSSMMLSNAFHCHALQRLARHDIFLQEFGEEFLRREAKIRRATHKRFWSPEDGLYRDAIREDSTPSPIFSQFANCAAVVANICSEQCKAGILHRITDEALVDPIAPGYTNSTAQTEAIVQAATPWSVYWLCRAFFESGREVEAIAHIKSIFGEFKELPTIPEVRIQHGNTALAQGACVGLSHLLPGFILGIQPVAGGWSKVSFRPHPGGLTWAEGELRTPLGLLKARWDYDDGAYKLKMTKPEEMEVNIQFRGIDDLVGKGEYWEGRATRK